ncbi:hypothetical protein KKF91_05315, partial [Myxococcota bacterium]|nr:hypothetical protein [Myxococcota bacterium]
MRTSLILALSALSLHAAQAQEIPAQEIPAAEGIEIIHTPISSAEAGQAIKITAQINGDWRAEALT